MRIQHNIAAMNSYRNYTANTGALSKNLEKLSSGYKINRAGDDAAGLAISEKMRAQISSLKQASNNVKDGISLVKTAEGALQEVQDMMNRMVTLATQSANGTYDNEVDRANLQKEVESLKSEINRIADSSNFNGKKLLDGSLTAVAKVTDGGLENDKAVTVMDFAGKTGNAVIGAKFSVGEDEYTFVETGKGSGADGAAGDGEIAVDADATAVDIATAVKGTVAGAGTGEEDDQVKLTSADATPLAVKQQGLELQIGESADEYNKMMVSVGNMHTKALGIDEIDISKQDDAAAAIKTIKDAINTVSSTRGDLGAIQNRLEHTTNNLAIMTENIQDAESTIRDVDIADEMTTYTKNNILLQSAQAMLAQANQMPQGVLQLLQ